MYHTAVVSVEQDMFQCVWNELDYCIDIYHVTKRFTHRISVT
jgi:hypothetical protein